MDRFVQCHDSPSYERSLLVQLSLQTEFKCNQFKLSGLAVDTCVTCSHDKAKLFLLLFNDSN